MISVGSRDGRKGIGLGFDVPKQMEETELEEGEACSFQEDDLSIDPDVALSYLDEKLQNVLGHFQKDFEGGVSAENLGAKFGGYGSFLPTYARSPVWPHPRSPSRLQNSNAANSPNNFHLEGGRLNSVVTPSAPQTKGELASACSVLPSVMALPSASDAAKSVVCEPSTRAKVYPPRSNSDQRTLKVRIKVGSDNLSTRRNAEIYSGLGLDISPSSSLDESPMESEGFSHVPEAPEESPTSILQMMTSFLIEGGCLLSPLPRDLLSLPEKKIHFGDIRSGPPPMDGQNLLNSSGNGLASLKGDDKVVKNKRTQSVEIKEEVEIGSKKLSQSGNGGSRKKEVENDSACEQLVSNTLKLPIIANSYTSGGMDKRSNGRGCDLVRESGKGGLNDKLFDDMKKEKLLEPFHQEADWVVKPNGKANSAGNALEDKKSNFLNASVSTTKDGNFKAEKVSGSSIANLNASKGKKSVKTESVNPPKQKVSQENMSVEPEHFKGLNRTEFPSSGGKKKLKGSQIHGNTAPDLPEVNTKADTSLSRKVNNTYSDEYLPTNKVEKDFGKAIDTYKDFFGDIRLEEEEEEYGTDSLDSSHDDHKDSELVDKSSSAFNNGSKDNSRGKKRDKTSQLEKSSIMAQEAAPVTHTEHMSVVAPAMVAPAVIEENWVCCDKCQQWRVLPVGVNTEDLPDKWICSMLTWLPGMNSCSVSEEDTYKAMAEYNASFPGIQNNLHGHGAESLANAWNANMDHQNHNFHSLPSTGKKKHGFKELSNQDGHPQGSHSMKKNPQSMVKNKNSYDVNHLPVINELDTRHLSMLSDSPSEKHRHMQKEKNRTREHSSHKGDTKKVKMKNRRDVGEDPRVSKKIKRGVPDTGGDWMSDHAVGPFSTSADVAVKDSSKHKERLSSKDTKHGMKHNIHLLDKKQKNGLKILMDDKSVDAAKCDNRGVSKKRKEKDGEGNGIYSGSIPSTGFRDSIKEEASESDQGKSKKSRPDGEGREPNKKVGVRIEKRGDNMNHEGIGKAMSQWSLDGGLLKRDLGPLQPSLAATSSSSKVSGSRKTTANLQDLKGSPVESVSSSPLRFPNPDLSTSTRRNVVGMDGAFMVRDSPTRCSDGENIGKGERSGTERKKKTADTTQHTIFDSSAIDRDRALSQSSGGKAKRKTQLPENTNNNMPTCRGDALGDDMKSFDETQASDFHNDEYRYENHHRANGSRPRKPRKESSPHSKSNERSHKIQFSNGKVKISDSSNDYHGDHAHQDDTREGKNKLDKTGSRSEKVDKSSSMKNCKLTETSKRGSHLKVDGHSGPFKAANTPVQNAMSTPNKNQLVEHDDERKSKRLSTGKNARTDVASGRGSSLPLPPSGGGGESEIHIACEQPFSRSQKGRRPDMQSVASEGDDKLSLHKKMDNLNVTQNSVSRQCTPNGHRVKDNDAVSPVRRELNSQAASSALKEAKNLKHMADRLKNVGSFVEGAGLYFEACLKFLHAASLLESCNSDSARSADHIMSMQIYSSTAKLCEFCAHEYEKLKHMGTVALAYKLVEVAYMRVIYLNHATADRDRHELQLSLQMVPPGESPSSSASDVDNLNNPVMADRLALTKGTSSPQVAGSHVIAARNRPHFSRLLTFAQDVNFAMEASRKSRVAFEAANSSLEDTQHKEGISCIKAALDFNFQDMEGLLRLVRLAMEAFSKG